MWLIIAEPYDDGQEAFYVEGDSEESALAEFKLYFRHWPSGRDTSPEILAVVDLQSGVAPNLIMPPNGGWLAYAKIVAENAKPDAPVLTLVKG